MKKISAFLVAASVVTTPVLAANDCSHIEVQEKIAVPAAGHPRAIIGSEEIVIDMKKQTICYTLHGNDQTTLYNGEFYEKATITPQKEMCVDITGKIPNTQKVVATLADGGQKIDGTGFYTLARSRSLYYSLFWQCVKQEMPSDMQQAPQSPQSGGSGPGHFAR